MNNNPYDILQYRMPYKWADTLVKTALQGIPLEEATKDWDAKEVDDFVEHIACGASVVEVDAETTEYKREEVTVTMFSVDEEGWNILEGSLTATPKPNTKLRELLSTKSPWE
jgi:uncharacterized protein (DUF1778 family)